jgi:hypothetical protein|tara:strand:- start:2365 stop:5205 length:2841 start_codon:yes stop_codon:yes gene_type:complete
MAHVVWKVVNGYGPYASVHDSVWAGGGKVAGKYLAYLGSMGGVGDYGGVFPGHHITYDGKRLLIRDVDPALKKKLKPGPQKKMTAITDMLAKGVPPKAIKIGQGKGKGTVKQGPIVIKSHISDPPTPQKWVSTDGTTILVGGKPVKEEPIETTVDWVWDEGKKLSDAVIESQTAKVDTIEELKDLEVSPVVKEIATAVHEEYKGKGFIPTILGTGIGPTSNQFSIKIEKAPVGSVLMQPKGTHYGLSKFAGAWIKVEDDKWINHDGSSLNNKHLANIQKSAATSKDFDELITTGKHQELYLAPNKVTKAIQDKAAQVIDTPKELEKAGVPAPADPVAKPKVGPIGVDSKGKPLIKGFQVKQMETMAAAKNFVGLESYKNELHDKLLATSKKAALSNAYNELLAQMLGTQAPIEQSDSSEQQAMIEAVAEKDVKLPEGKALSTKILQAENEKILDGSKNWDKDLELISGKKGSLEGGLYKDPKTQSLHYIKFPSNAEHVKAEALAGLLYKLAYVPVADTRVITMKGQTALMSDWIKDVEPMTFSEMSKHPDVRKNFVADAWLANWDVVGLDSDNIVKGPGKTAYRIDPGGSLTFRAQGKPKDFSATKVLELETMRDAGTAPQASKVFKNLTIAELQAGAKAIQAVSDMDIDAAVDVIGKSAGKMKDAETLKATLKARRDLLIKEILNMKPPKKLTKAELNKLTKELHPEVAEILKAKASDITIAGIPQKTRTALADQLTRLQLSNIPAGKRTSAHAAVKRRYSGWKSSAAGTDGTMIRLAAAAQEGPKELKKHEMTIDAFLKAVGHSGINPSPFVEGADWQKDGEHLVTGLAATRQVNNALSSLQQKGKKTVTIYRRWNPDQVKVLGWQNAKVGDTIQMSPEVYSWSQSPNVFGGASHGAIRTRTELPITSLLLTDRLNNPGGGKYVSEDEILFRAPIKMEVTQVGA